MVSKLDHRDIYVDPKNLFDEIGLLDINFKNLNPMNNKSYSNSYKTNFLNKPQSIFDFYNKLAMYSKAEYMIKGIYENQVCLVVAGTGAGKTVILPRIILHTIGYKGRVVMTNPKTIPTRKAAEFAAITCDVELGKEVGYKYKGHSETYNSTENKLLFCTDGTILAMLKHDPLLMAFDVVVIDEAHERNINIDLIFLLLRRALLLRPSLKLVIVSATINEDKFINYFSISYFKFIRLDGGGGTNYPIKLFYLEKAVNKLNPNGEIIGEPFLEAAVKRVCDILLSSDSGDILVFLSGSSDIMKGCEMLHLYLKSLSDNINNETFCITLSSGVDDLHTNIVIDEKYYKNNTLEAQNYDLLASGPFKRKVVFATEVAESSVTIDGLKYVIECGISKQSIYYGDKNLQALEKKYISKANHKQRRGRVGRTSPGECHCIFTLDEYNKFKDYPDPPITIINFTNTILDFLYFEQYVSHIDLPIIINPTKIDFDSMKNNEKLTLNIFLNELLDLPNINNIQQGIIRLYYLKMIYINNNKAFLSPLGKICNKLNGVPKIELQRAMISSYNYKCTKEVCAIVSMITKLGAKLTSLFSTKILTDITSLWFVDYGEFILLLDIFNEFVYREYDQFVIKDGKKITIRKLGGTKMWCRKYKIKYHIMVEVYELYLENVKDLDAIINTELRMYINADPNNIADNFTLFTDYKPELFQDIRLNVIRALLDGYFINIMKQNPNLTFTTCFPSITNASIDKRQSLYINSNNNEFKYCFYYEYTSISMCKTFNIVNGIPKEVIKHMIQDDNIYDVITKCLQV